MITIHIQQAGYMGRDFAYSGNGRVRYVQPTLLGTAVETQAIRALTGSWSARAPGDWQRQTLAQTGAELAGCLTAARRIAAEDKGELCPFHAAGGWGHRCNHCEESGED